MKEEPKEIYKKGKRKSYGVVVDKYLLSEKYRFYSKKVAEEWIKWNYGDDYDKSVIFVISL